MRVRRERRARPRRSLTHLEFAIGFVTNFFDTLGIGSFAPTTSVFKLRHLVADERIPGTLNVGHTLPTVAQALIFIAIVAVDIKTLILMIFASVVGAWVGAGVVASWSRRKVQIGMGSALAAAAVFFIMRNLEVFPAGGDTLGLEGERLVAGLVGNFVLGAIMTVGVGLYAPCMILVALLGMKPKTAFPIMMGSCAFLMPVASMRFIREGSYALKPALGLALGGIPGVLLAAYVVKELNVVTVRWLEAFVIDFQCLNRSAMSSARRRSSGLSRIDMSAGSAREVDAGRARVDLRVGVGAGREVPGGAVGGLEADLAGALERRCVGVPRALSLPTIEDAGGVLLLLGRLAPVARRQRAVLLPRAAVHLERAVASARDPEQAHRRRLASAALGQRELPPQPFDAGDAAVASIALRSFWLTARMSAAVSPVAHAGQTEEIARQLRSVRVQDERPAHPEDAAEETRLEDHVVARRRLAAAPSGAAGLRSSNRPERTRTRRSRLRASAPGADPASSCRD